VPRLTHRLRARKTAARTAQFASDTVARMSEDEFVIVLDQLTLREDAQFPDCGVGVSIGVAIYPDCAVWAKALIDIADRETYIVKRNGGRGIETAACETSSGDRSPLRTAASG